MFGDPPSDSTVRRVLGETCDPITVTRVARARARVRAQVWKLIEAGQMGFPWLRVAGKPLCGWIVIDIDATLITAHSAKQGAAATFKKGFGFHPLAAGEPTPPSAWRCWGDRGTPAQAMWPIIWPCWPRRSVRSPRPARAESATMRYCPWHLPARLVHHARQRTLKISATWPWKEAFLTCWHRLCALPKSG
ncbi:hypothetical protein GCM10023196_060410 [Actinoallomurus vinaceus]|uniref:Transposase DDE domain-containing protein n=1 Tax=Actinoallomurus vinaceus TaxID=1080074 RepID=A0ABP8UJF2_9ACTN